MIKSLLAGVTTACAIALLSLSVAQADPRDRGPGWGWGNKGHSRSWSGHDSWRYKNYHDQSTRFWGSVFGSAIGSWIGTRANEREYEDERNDEADLEPWSRAWFDYCSQRYKSFDPKTGRYFGFDGQFHFCKAGER